VREGLSARAWPTVAERREALRDIELHSAVLILQGDQGYAGLGDGHSQWDGTSGEVSVCAPTANLVAPRIQSRVRRTHAVLAFPAPRPVTPSPRPAEPEDAFQLDVERTFATLQIQLYARVVRMHKGEASIRVRDCASLDRMYHSGWRLDRRHPTVEDVDLR
jgi:hypothetical protein